MLITGTFLDEISHDIPAQNWGRAEWREDFRLMKAVGIDTVILIRCGHKRWATYPSRVLAREMDCFEPPEDLVRLFLDLSEEFGMGFFFGTYDSGKYWHEGKYSKEIQISKDVVSEVWEKYGSSPAFKGFYLSCEVSGKFRGHRRYLRRSRTPLQVAVRRASRPHLPVHRREEGDQRL